MIRISGKRQHYAELTHTSNWIALHLNAMSSLFCFVSEYHKQCQDLETEIAGLAEVGIGTETEMAAADSGAAAGSGAGAGLEVILPLQLPVTISMLLSFQAGAA